tara:strand:+ start:3292 stop:3492 length:201 start_codon:yes stop_codon:yes gene_type:complete
MAKSIHLLLEYFLVSMGSARRRPAGRLPVMVAEAKKRSPSSGPIGLQPSADDLARSVIHVAENQPH